MKIAIIGGGISGIVAGRCLLQAGHEVVVFERSASLGGVWAVAYPEVRLQNIAAHYRASDFPWPFSPDLHPTKEQIVEYLRALVSECSLDLRLQHTIVTLQEEPNGWLVEHQNSQGTIKEHFDFVVSAAGQYTGKQHSLNLTGQEQFTGKILTDRDIKDLSVLERQSIAVVGFGKSAVDVATFAAERGAQVHHIFREPRWLLPKYLFGIHSSKVLFSRISTVMIPSWVQPSKAEKFLHTRLKPIVGGFWSMIETLVKIQCGLHGLQRDPEARRRLALLQPKNSVTYEMRSATALAPDHYFSQVSQGKIEPHLGEVAGFGRDSIRLTNGQEIPCDLVVLSTGFQSPQFPFLPPPYKALVEKESDGVQLYRHMLHPRIPKMAFAGYNHGFLHVPAIEVSMLWLSAYLRGDLVLPSMEEMESCIEEIRAWKREHILFEPSRSCAINTRFHQYLDVLLLDLGLNPYRKSNALAELVSGYTAEDYRGLLGEYELSRQTAILPRHPLALST
jgi:dimethylaniline monooxygenase (N-oxide forming)